MQLKYTKMHALGNDFMVIDGVNQQVNLSTALIAAWVIAIVALALTNCY